MKTFSKFFNKSGKSLLLMMVCGLVIAATALVSCDSSSDDKGGGGTKLQVATPTASPEAGELASGTTITLATSTEGATIYYTIDESIPTTDSIEYSDDAKPTIRAATTIKAIAVKSGMTDSEILTAAYTVTTPTYSIGATGPAGGIIFYVDTDDQYAGWTYLEAAPADLEGTYEWGGYGSDCATGTAVGTGAANTAELITQDHDTPSSGSGLHLAARAAADYTYAGYDDWFLPSKDELKLMYDNLKVVGLGGTSSRYYWSSSQYDSNNAWYQDFGLGGQGYISKDVNFYVCCVRAF